MTDQAVRAVTELGEVERERLLELHGERWAVFGYARRFGKWRYGEMDDAWQRVLVWAAERLVGGALPEFEHVEQRVAFYARMAFNERWRERMRSCSLSLCKGERGGVIGLEDAGVDVPWPERMGGDHADRILARVEEVLDSKRWPAAAVAMREFIVGVREGWIEPFALVSNGRGLAYLGRLAERVGERLGREVKLDVLSHQLARARVQVWDVLLAEGLVSGVARNGRGEALGRACLGRRKTSIGKGV